MTAARPQNAPYISLKLPQGYQAKDYNVTLRVDITDVRESSYSDIVTVKASLIIIKRPTPTTGKFACCMISTLASKGLRDVCECLCVTSA